VKVPNKKKPTHNKAEYDQTQKKVTWTIKKFRGGQTQTLNAIITLKNEVNSYQIRKEIGPIKMDFEVNNYTASNVFVKYLRGAGGFDQKKPPQRWLRYITKSNSYINRV
jgi:hypothetical protein